MRLKQIYNRSRKTGFKLTLILFFLLLGWFCSGIFFIYQRKKNAAPKPPEDILRCTRNLLIISDAVERLNRKHKNLLKRLEFKILIKNGYISATKKPECPGNGSYRSLGDLSKRGIILCTVHGSTARPSIEHLEKLQKEEAILEKFAKKKTAIEENFQKGKSFYKKKMYKMALLFFLDAHQESPKNARYLLAIGYVYRKLGRYKKARKYFLKARRLKPGSKKIGRLISGLKNKIESRKFSGPIDIDWKKLKKPVYEVARAIGTYRGSESLVTKCIKTMRDNTKLHGMYKSKDNTLIQQSFISFFLGMSLVLQAEKERDVVKYEKGMRIIHKSADDYFNPLAMAFLAKRYSYWGDFPESKAWMKQIDFMKDHEESYYYLKLSLQIASLIRRKSGEKWIFVAVLARNRTLNDSFKMLERKKEFHKKAIEPVVKKRIAVKVRQMLATVTFTKTKIEKPVLKSRTKTTATKMRITGAEVFDVHRHSNFKAEQKDLKDLYGLLSNPGFFPVSTNIQNLVSDKKYSYDAVSSFKVHAILSDRLIFTTRKPGEILCQPKNELDFSWRRTHPGNRSTSDAPFNENGTIIHWARDTIKFISTETGEDYFVVLHKKSGYGNCTFSDKHFYAYYYNNHDLVKISFSTGRVLWIKKYPFKRMKRLVFQNAHLFLLSSLKVLAVSAEDGSLKWERKLNDKYPYLLLNPKVTKNRIIVFVGRGNSLNDAREIFCLATKTGEILWHINRDRDNQLGSPLLDEEYLYYFEDYNPGLISRLSVIDGTKKVALKFLPIKSWDECSTGSTWYTHKVVDGKKVKMKFTTFPRMVHSKTQIFSATIDINDERSVYKKRHSVTIINKQGGGHKKFNFDFHIFHQPYLTKNEFWLWGGKSGPWRVSEKTRMYTLYRFPIN
ncbi:tetratricopeptide repeat protein [Candidatus Riflebacteria bacterium]